MTKQQMDQIMQAKQSSSTAITTDDNAETNDNLSAVENTIAQNGGDLPLSTASQLSSTSINDYSQQQALDIIKKTPDYALGQYVDKFMAKGSSEVITDKRRFAERAVEELYKPNDNQPLAGTVKLSSNSTLPATSLDTSTLNKNTKLFAHLDTDGKVPASAFVFVKWVNNQTGQVLLFEKKDIIANSDQNWVSFIPYDGWLEGSYDIRFYQFSSELQPVAQLTYNIYTINDNGQGENSGAISTTASTTVRR